MPSIGKYAGYTNDSMIMCANDKLIKISDLAIGTKLKSPTGINIWVNSVIKYEYDGYIIDMTNYDKDCQVKMTFQTPYVIDAQYISANYKFETFCRPANNSELSSHLIRYTGIVYNLVLDSDDRRSYPTNYLFHSNSNMVMLSGINTWITYHRTMTIPTNEKRIACAGDREMTALIIELKGIRNCPDPDINPMINVLLPGVWSNL